MTRRSTAACALAFGFLVSTPSCHRGTPPVDGDARGADAVVRFVRAASSGDLERVLELADAEAARADPAGLRDLLVALAGWSDPRVVRASELGDGGRAVDLEASFLGGGTVRGTFVAGERHDGSWRVMAVFAPAADWPRRTAPSQDGLSVSPPPR